MELVPHRSTPILVVDDDDVILLSIKAAVLSSGLPEPALVSDSRRVMELVRTRHFQVVLLDLIMPHISGMDILKKIKEEFPWIECIIVTAVDEVASAVEAMKLGAYDYLVKPIENEKLIIAINHALEKHSLRKKLSIFERTPSFSDLMNPQAFKDMVAEDEAMALVFHQAEAAAPTDYSVLITGESGTGKEMIARVIHKLSYRSEGPFVAVNMGSFSKTLFEDEFFGHAKGAFTGAFAEKEGFFRAAQGGVLFLDEIADLDLDLQGKILRVLEARELYRLGNSKPRSFDVRFIAASNRDMNEEVRNGRFRRDLFYRLNMFHIDIPPLRERKKDILPLARHFLRVHARKNRKKIDTLAPDLAERLLEYPFPGNVRELDNIIASAVLLERGRILSLSSAKELKLIAKPARDQKDRPLTLAEMERQHIIKALETTRGNRTRAAKILGIGLRTLQRKLKTFKDQPTQS